jgi:type IV secretory pathway VirB10-like protein
MSADYLENEGRVKRRVIGGVVAVVLLGLGAAFVFKGPSEPPKKKAKPPEIVAVTPLPPPPPPPPTPPEPEKPPEPKPEEMVEQEPVEQAEPEQPGPEEPPDEALGTSITGNGSGDFNLSTRGNGRPGGGGAGGGTGSARAAFLHGVSTTLQAELKRHPALKNATFNVVLNVRVSGEGRVTAITPEPSTGDPSIDRILSNDFIGVRFPQPPPSGKAGVVKTRATSTKPRA